MALRQISLVLLVIGFVSAQNYRVCIPSTERTLCNNLDRGDSQVVCEPVESRVDCAIKLSRGTADIGVFNEEETILLGQQQPNVNRVIATIRDVSRTEPFAFEAVAVVPNSHTGGLDGLRGGRYCHPGFDQSDQRWSPRVLRTFENVVARTDRCPDLSTNGKTADELEAETLNGFFSAACRPGRWSANTTVDDDLKRRFPNLCSLCGPTNPTCASYTIDMGVSVAGVNNANRHIQALECLRTNSNGTVAYVAWQHVREYFNARNPEAATSFALLCPDGSTRALTSEILNTATSPCAFVRQPWSTIVATSANAAAIQANLRTWWPNGANPADNSWQSVLFNGVIGGSNARVTFEEVMTLNNYTSANRNLSSIDATSSCLPAVRWCTLSSAEQTKCSWVRNSAHVLGIQPSISCVQRASVFECLDDIKDNRADVMSSSANYGYLARKHYQLSPVKLVQNSRNAQNAFSRVAAFVKESSIATISRFENLRGKKACFPEFGGISYVAFLRTAHERGVISASECDYARAAGEFFEGACAPGALNASHALTENSSFNSSQLCTLCQPSITIMGNYSDFICTFDNTNKFFGNNGSLACLADPASDVAFLQTQNIEAKLQQLNLQGSQFRALCRNNTLAATTGVNIDDNCLLAHVVDAEVITRRNDPLYNAINVLLDTLDLYFGYVAESGTQLINLEIFSPFDGISDLLFKDSAIGLTEPTVTTTNEPARNYIELFQHLESCTGAAPPSVGLASRNFYSIVTLIVMAVMTRFVVY